MDEEFDVGEYALEANGIFIGMVNIQPNKDGTIKPPRLEYNAKDDVIIKISVSLLQPKEQQLTALKLKVWQMTMP